MVHAHTALWSGVLTFGSRYMVLFLSPSLQPRLGTEQGCGSVGHRCCALPLAMRGLLSFAPQGQPTKPSLNVDGVPLGSTDPMLLEVPMHTPPVTPQVSSLELLLPVRGCALISPFPLNLQPENLQKNWLREFYQVRAPEQALSR